VITWVVDSLITGCTFPFGLYLFLPRLAAWHTASILDTNINQKFHYKTKLTTSLIRTTTITTLLPLYLLLLPSTPTIYVAAKMPAVTVTTVTTGVQTSMPTPKELTEFNDRDCPICWLPTISIATKDQLNAEEKPNGEKQLNGDEQLSGEEQLNDEKQLNVTAAKQTKNTFMTDTQSSGAMASQSEATASTANQPEVTDTTGEQFSAATASQPEAAVNPEGQPEASATTGLQSSDATAEQLDDATTTIPTSVKTPCNHIFHVDCLESWINGWRETAPVPFIPELPPCPYCRTELPVTLEKYTDCYGGKTFEEIVELIKGCGVQDLEVFGQNTAYYCLKAEEAMGLMNKVYIAEVVEDVKYEDEDEQKEIEGEERGESGVAYTEDWWW
jgi:hypothetical protein